MDSKIEQPTQCLNTKELNNAFHLLELKPLNQPRCACFICSGNKFQPALMTSDGELLTIRFPVAHYNSKGQYLDLLDGIALFNKSSEAVHCSYIEFEFTQLDQQLYVKLSTCSYSNLFKYQEQDLVDLLRDTGPIELIKKQEKSRIHFKRTEVETISLALDSSASGVAINEAQLETFLKKLAAHESAKPEQGKWFAVGSAALLEKTLQSFCSPVCQKIGP